MHFVELNSMRWRCEVLVVVNFYYVSSNRTMPTRYINFVLKWIGISGTCTIQ